MTQLMTHQLLAFFTFSKLGIFRNNKKSQTGDLQTFFSLGFAATDPGDGMVTVLVDAGDTSDVVENVDSDSHDEDDMKPTIHETSNNTKQITLTPKHETKYRGIKKNKMHLRMRYIGRYIGILCANNLSPI